MKSWMIAVCTAVLAILLAAPAHAQSRMKACGNEWSALKKANQTEGKKWADFRKECLARTASATTAPKDAAEAKPSGAKSAKRSSAKAKSSGGRQAMLARQRACSEEWKSDKAAGKVEAGMKWPKFWSACNARKKAAGT
jgi:hypothetical protein